MKTSLAAAIATTLVAAPAAWRGLGADIQSDGPAVRPDQQVLHLDGTDVTLQLDRGTLRSGDKVSAILVASAAKSHAVTVDLATLEDMGMGAERVENPPLQIDRRSLTLQAQPGGGPPVVATIKIGSKKAKPGFASWYDMYLLPHRAKVPGSRYDEVEQSAHTGFAEWSGNTIGMTIEAPAVLPVEGPFAIAVRVKNTTKQPITYIFEDVGGAVTGYNEMAGGLQLDVDNYDVAAIDDDAAPRISDEQPLKPGGEYVERYMVTPKHDGISHFNIVAHIRVNNGGAMDVVGFDRPTVTIEKPSLTAAR